MIEKRRGRMTKIPQKVLMICTCQNLAENLIGWMVVRVGKTTHNWGFFWMKFALIWAELNRNSQLGSVRFICLCCLEVRTESSRVSFLFFPFHIPYTSNTLFFFLNAWKPYPSLVSCTPQIDKNLITFDQLYLVVAFLSCVGASMFQNFRTDLKLNGVVWFS